VATPNKPEFAPGIPAERSTQQIPTVSAPTQWEFALQRHLAERAGEHLDLRLGDPETGHAHSWALRQLPAPGEKRLAVQQPTHTVDYMNFTGAIESGYGKGQVALDQRGKTEVVRSSDDHVRFNLYKGKETEEFALRRLPGTKNWLLQNVTTSRDVGPGISLPSSKPKYKTTKPENLDVSDPNTELQAKIDGAHVLYQFKSPGTLPRVVSYRPTERATGVIEHTHKLPGFHEQHTPAALKDTILRGELYATDSKGKALPAAQVGGLLNANVWKSREKQQEHGQLKPVVFDVVQWKGKNVEDAPYAEKKEYLQQAIKAAPWLSIPRTATTPDAKKKLMEDIRTGKEPSTTEGVVEWHKDRAIPTKSKFLEERDVVVRKIFAEEGEKRQGTMAGGFEFSYTKNGPIIGRVGTGMSHDMKRDLLQNPTKYEGLTARIMMQRAPKEYAPRAPVFHSFHLDQDVPEGVKTAVVEKKGLEDMRKLGSSVGAEVAEAAAESASKGSGNLKYLRFIDPLIDMGVMAQRMAMSRGGKKPTSEPTEVKKTGSVLTLQQLHRWGGFVDELDKMAEEMGVYKGKHVPMDSVKKKVDFQGIPIYIDRPKGFVMSGTDKEGTPWSRTYHLDYGYIPYTLGGDGDELDVFMGPDSKASDTYWVRQVQDDGSFDEYKCLLGFSSKEEAVAAYKQHIPEKYLGSVLTLGVEPMKALVGVEPAEKTSGIQVGGMEDYYPTAFKVQASEQKRLMKALHGSGVRMEGSGPLSPGWGAGYGGISAPQATMANPYASMGEYMGAMKGTLSGPTGAALAAYGLL
jgi:hypothetical protein